MCGPEPLLNLGIQPATDAHTGLQGAHGRDEWDSPTRQANMVRTQAEFCWLRPDAQSPWRWGTSAVHNLAQQRASSGWAEPSS